MEEIGTIDAFDETDIGYVYTPTYYPHYFNEGHPEPLNFNHVPLGILDECQYDYDVSPLPCYSESI